MMSSVQEGREVSFLINETDFTKNYALSRNCECVNRSFSSFSEFWDTKPCNLEDSYLLFGEDRISIN